jgi:hypothetical protein
MELFGGFRVAQQVTADREAAFGKPDAAPRGCSERGITVLTITVRPARLS